MTTHPTSAATQHIPTAQLTYVSADTPAKEPIAQAVAAVSVDPDVVRLTPSSGRPWDLDPRTFRTVKYAGALTVHARLNRGVKASLLARDWMG